jgi:hypothetical protein
MATQGQTARRIARRRDHTERCRRLLAAPHGFGELCELIGRKSAAPAFLAILAMLAAAIKFGEILRHLFQAQPSGQLGRRLNPAINPHQQRYGG